MSSERLKSSILILNTGLYDGFTKGWRILNYRERDNLDYEWETWKSFCLTNYKWFLLHFFGSELCRTFKRTYLPYFHAAIGCLFIILNYSSFIFLTILIKNILFFFLIRFHRKSIIWCLGIGSIVILNACKTDKWQPHLMKSYSIDEHQFYQIVLIICWNLLKSLSFTLDAVSQLVKNNNGKLTEGNSNVGGSTSSSSSSNNSNFFQLLYYLAYTFYFPNLLLGPLIIYERYRKMLELNEKYNYNLWNDLSVRLIKLLWNLMRVGFWLLFTDFSLHFLYINNLQFNIKIVSELNSWALYAFGYLIGQFFYNKYVVSYGFTLLMANSDRIDTPGLPKCIGRIHQYSDMWKYFDQGLYEFLFKYIYSQCCNKYSGKLMKFIASLITFLFIYLWHGYFLFIFIWTVLNFVWVQLEAYAKRIFNRIQQCGWLNHRWFNISEQNQWRLIGFFGGQLFIPAAMSNFYFIAGDEIGNLFMYNTYISLDWCSYIILSGCCYCIYHTSEMIKRWETTKAIDNHNKNE